MIKKISKISKYISDSDRINYDKNSFIESREPLGVMLAILGVFC